MNNVTVAFDVNNTLIDNIEQLEGTEIEGLDDTPRYEIIQIFYFFQNKGCDMYIWSTDGPEYAEEWAKKLGLSAKIVEKGSFIPDITFDDTEVSLGKVNIRV